MASELVVEDGTGKSDADSYNSTAEVAAYAALWGKTFDGTDDEQDQACRAATRAVDDLEDRFPSTRYLTTQALAWPRGWFRDRNGVLVNSGTIPQAVKDTHAELAIRARGGDDLCPDTTNRVLTSTTYETDAYSETKRFAPAHADVNGAPLKEYPIVERRLRAILVARTFSRL